MLEEIRKARHDDAPVLAQLEAQAREALVDARGGERLLAEQPPVDDWDAILVRADRRVFVACIDEVVVGYLELELDPSGLGTVLQVYVESEARELGFGDAMIALAIEAIREVGGNAIQATALPGDRDTKNLYERAGITARKLTVHKWLSDPASSADASR